MTLCHMIFIVKGLGKYVLCHVPPTSKSLKTYIYPLMATVLYGLLHCTSCTEKVSGS